MSTTECGFDSLPNELVEMLLQSACIVCCSNLKNQFENVIQNLSRVCLRWRQIIDNRRFREATIAKLIRCGYCHLYYKRPRLELKIFEGESESTFYSLDGDYYMPGAPAGMSIEPLVCLHFVETDQPEPAATQSRRKRNAVKKHHVVLDSVNIPFLKPPDPSSLRRKSFVMSQHWCWHNKCLYIGYYCAKDIRDPAAPFVCLRLSRGAQQGGANLPRENLRWPIRSDDVAAWVLPPHPEDVAIFASSGCYCFRVSDRTGNVVIVDNINMRLIVYDENGQPLGVVMMPEEVSGKLFCVLEIVTRQDDMQYIVQYESDRHHICRVAIDRATRSVSGDVDSCPQYKAKVMARYDDDEHRGSYFSLVADVDDDGLVVVVLATKNRDKMHKMAVLRPSDLRRIGCTITLPFNKFFTFEQLDSHRGHFNFSIRDKAKAPLYCCIVRAAKL